MFHLDRQLILICTVALIGDSRVQAFTNPLLRSPLTASRFKLASVTKPCARLWSMQANNLVGDRFEDDDQKIVVRVQI